MSDAPSPTPSRRDRDLRRLRGAAWALGAGAAVVTGALSVAAAHAFKGHDGTKRTSAPTPAPVTHAARVRVPPPQRVPAIVGEPTPLQPPAQPPAAATATAPQQAAPASQPAAPAPQPAPQPQTSGGS
jgi:hypothetical protein